MLGYQGLHVAILLIMGSYLIARSIGGRLHAQAHATFDTTMLMWHYTSVQGAVLLGVVNFLPVWMR